ncbi:ER-golgi trafficking TRAPP I complex 85 kDa subunit-domain-containing protein [Astrocystis sublimbata]|nr:ER-golgi trafficking TRAPP I complex 85 kDa subunit-domain-containing protein [Astrocystis sublimbata]
MQSFNHDAPTQRISTPPLVASAALKRPTSKTRQSLGNTVPVSLSQSEVSLPYRHSNPTAASLYASTFSPPASRSQSPIGRPLSARTTEGSVFGSSPNNAFALAARAGDGPGDPLNLILRAFVPHVAIYTSDDTDVLLAEKGFGRGLWELLRPFGERVQGKVIIRDSNGSSRTYEDYSLHFTRFGEGLAHPEPNTAGLRSPQGPRMNGASQKPGEPTPSSRAGNTIAEVEAVVNRHLTYAEGSFFGTPLSPTTNHKIGTEVPSPYYSLYLRRLLSGLQLTPHETFAHPVACVIAISSRNQAPIETLRRLYTESSTGDKRLPTWINGEFLRYYVLVHDEEKDDITRSMSLFDQMKRNLGLHCHLLRIRGTRSLATDDDSIRLPRCEWMSAAEELAELRRSEENEDYEDPTKYIFESDATAIRTFIREMAMQSIIPTMERNVSLWNDQVASKRKGLAGRFVGLTRRWGFGSNSRSSGSGSSSGSNYDTLGFYTSETPEAIMRKLADYAFMLRDWKLAHSVYEILRGDFNNDKAWRYHAAANEMGAISMLLLPQNISSKTRAETIDAMLEAAFYSYLTRCTAPYGALRSLALGLELLRLRGGSSVDDAARWGIRLLESKILGPVGDALLKERLAVCYASKDGIGSQGWGSRKRKSALWSTLAAETWLAQGKCAQSRRCLNEARQTYAELDLPALKDDEEGVRSGGGNGIDGFGFASGFMGGIGRELDERAEMERVAAGGEEDEEEEEEEEDEDGEGPHEEKSGGREVVKEREIEEEVVEESSEALDTKVRRGVSSLAFAGGAAAAGLESAPLRGQVGAVGEVSEVKGKDEVKKVESEDDSDEEEEDDDDEDDDEEEEEEEEDDEDEDDEGEEDEDEEDDDEEEDSDEDEDEDSDESDERIPPKADTMKQDLESARKREKDPSGAKDDFG